ncbi:hypothetical protein B0H14DRAFT_3602938 [Mycena olivaceomarginata]|nr:hypothetical protein B0H14DRAFT_3602938 [Mycena olivaceomarginata]
MKHIGLEDLYLKQGSNAAKNLLFTSVWVKLTGGARFESLDIRLKEIHAIPPETKADSTQCFPATFFDPKVEGLSTQFAFLRLGLLDTNNMFLDQRFELAGLIRSNLFCFVHSLVSPSPNPGNEITFKCRVQTSGTWLQSYMHCDMGRHPVWRVVQPPD